MIYAALIADVIGSRRLLQLRGKVQLDIKRTISVLNDMFSPSLEKEVMFSAGDEVQGLFMNASSALLYARYLRRLQYPVEIRCGIGIGKLDFEINAGTSGEQDGPAYHYAREAISKLEKSNNSCIRVNSKTKHDYFINTYLEMSDVFEEQQSKIQREMLLLIDILTPIMSKKYISEYRYEELLNLIRNETTSSNEKGYWQNLNSIRMGLSDRDVGDYLRMESGNDRYLLMKGIAGEISQLRGTSRQNINKIIKAGNIEEIRKLDMAALRFLNTYLEG